MVQLKPDFQDWDPSGAWCVLSPRRDPSSQAARLVVSIMRLVKPDPWMAACCRPYLIDEFAERKIEERTAAR